MALFFPFQKEKSSLFGWVFRPYAIVSFWSKRENNWLDIAMIIDSGADYTLLPKIYIRELGIDIKMDAQPFSTRGAGGSSRVFLLKRKQKIRFGEWERNIPLGFIESNDIPPLLGRQEFMEAFKFTFHNHRTEIDNT